MSFLIRQSFHFFKSNPDTKYTVSNASFIVNDNGKYAKKIIAENRIPKTTSWMKSVFNFTEM